MSLLKAKVARLQEGSYRATVAHYEEVSRESGCYVIVTLAIQAEFEHLETDWISEGRLPYIARNLQRQFDKDFEDFEALLKHAKTHEFVIAYKEDAKWGPQFDYRG